MVKALFYCWEVEKLDVSVIYSFRLTNTGLTSGVTLLLVPSTSPRLLLELTGFFTSIKSNPGSKVRLRAWKFEIHQKHVSKSFYTSSSEHTFCTKAKLRRGQRGFTD